MKFFPVISVMIVVLMSLSCKKEGDIGRKEVLLYIEPGTEIDVKSIISNSNIAEKEIGIQITELDGYAEYDGNSALINLKLSKSLPDGLWKMSDKNDIPVEVKVNSRSAKIFAYYPYTPELVQGIGAGSSMGIDLPASQTYGSANDYLWSCQDKTLPEGGFSINSSYPEVFLRLNHSLSMVAFVFYKSGYTGEGRITSMKMRSKTASNIFRVNKSDANDLKMSLSNGGITGGSMVSALSLTGIDALITLEAKPEETPASLFSNKNFYMFLVPANILQREDIEFVFEIDGEAYTSPLPGTEALYLTPGNASIFTVKLSPNSLKITGVADWNLVSYEVSSGYDDLWYGMKPVKIGSLLWAPVNVGYDPVSNPYGLMFQWHRKYGQCYNEFPNPISVQGPVTIELANDVTNRNRFYFNSSGSYDCITPQLSSWDMSVNYNPCPEGWRVPSSAEFQSLISSGYTFDSSGLNNKRGFWFGGYHNTNKEGSVFLPLSGYIRGENTSPTQRNSLGLYWSSDTFSVYAKILQMDQYSVQINSWSRAAGLSIRCVKSL